MIIGLRVNAHAIPVPTADRLGRRREPRRLGQRAAEELDRPDAVDPGGLGGPRLLGELVGRVAEPGDLDPVERRGHALAQPLAQCCRPRPLASFSVSSNALSVDDLGRIGLELVEVRLRLIEELLDLVGGVLGDRERLDRVDLVLDAREHHLGRKLLELGARRLVIGPESLLVRRTGVTAARWSLSPWVQI